MSEILASISADPDPALIAGAWVLAVVCLFVGYYMGGTAWDEWFAVRIVQLKRHGTISGKYVELILITLTAGLLLFVDQLTPAVSIAGAIQKYWYVFATLVLLGYGIVLYHSLTVVPTVTPTASAYRDVNEFRRDLARGYIVYNLFSTVIFTFFVVAAMCVVAQFMADKAEFAKTRARLDDALLVIETWQFANASSVIAAIEEANSLLWLSIHGITEQINTVLLLFFFALVINMVVAYTPIRAAYTEDGVWYTHCITALVLLGVIVVGWYLYYTEYLTLIRSTIDKLSSAAVRAKVLGGDWEITTRYYALLNDLRARQGITGFVITLCSERGGVLLLFYALTWFYDRRGVGASESTSSNPPELRVVNADPARQQRAR